MEESLPNYYIRLFNGVSDALDALDANNPGKAREILILAQQDAEELYIDGDE